MKRGTLSVAALAFVSFLAGGLLYYLLQPGGPVESKAGTGKPLELQAIPLAGLDGDQTTLADWRDKLLVVNFWAPWCAPCRREIPALIEVQKQYASRGVRILGIAFDTPEQVRRFAAEYQIDYPLFLVGNRTALYNVAFDNPSGSLPYTALLDGDLKIVFRHNGELKAETLKSELENRL
ncbi:MAG: TlpA disulfide reductase family protein [Gammaproteobacteria bacterium]